jgi:hypothetical protein
MYYLKLFDEDLISFDMTNNLGLNITNIKVLSDNKEIFPINLIEEVNEKNIEEFISSRIIPKNRAFVQNILEEAGLNINDRKAIIDVSKGLSLIDSYWIVQDKTLKFKDYNLFDNDFSEVLSLVAFTGYASKRKELISSPEFTTNGMLPKAWRKLKDGIYLYKGGTASYEFANTGFEPYCEFYASQVADKMKIDHVSYGLNQWKNMISSSCKLFTSKDISYVQIGDVVTYGGIQKVYEYIKGLGFEQKFIDMILFDAICINPDRHYGNFGLLRNNHTGKFVDFAPIFDNGESLLSKTMPKTFENFEEFKQYIQKAELNVSYYGASYDDLVKEFCNKSDIAKLRRLLNFQFERNKSYYLSEKRLKALEYMIQERAKHFIDIINSIG